MDQRITAVKAPQRLFTQPQIVGVGRDQNIPLGIHQTVATQHTVTYLVLENLGTVDHVPERGGTHIRQRLETEIGKICPSRLVTHGRHGKEERVGMAPLQRLHTPTLGRETVALKVDSVTFAFFPHDGKVLIYVGHILKSRRQDEIPLAVDNIVQIHVLDSRGAVAQTELQSPVEQRRQQTIAILIVITVLARRILLDIDVGQIVIRLTPNRHRQKRHGQYKYHSPHIRIFFQVFYSINVRPVYLPRIYGCQILRSFLLTLHPRLTFSTPRVLLSLHSHLTFFTPRVSLSLHPASLFLCTPRLISSAPAESYPPTPEAAEL